MIKRLPVVCILGRTNVGKSTLFNAIARRRKAIVEDTPGVTRDKQYALVQEENIAYQLLDTGGLGDSSDDPLHKEVIKQTKKAVEESDLLLVIFDGIAGVHPQDNEIVDLVRRARKPAIFVINKCEKPGTELTNQEFYMLGIDEPIFISAAHRRGLGELRSQIKNQLNEAGFKDIVVEESEGEEKHEIRVAIVGRPNAGKSSILNVLCGEERALVSDIPGTTRDSLDAVVTRNGRDFRLIDTAGLRKKAKVEAGSIERYANLRSTAAVSEADVVCLILDPTREPFPSEQDKTLAQLVHERGKGLILVVNKWDLVEKNHKTAREYSLIIKREFPYIPYAPVIFTSAVTRRRCLSILDLVEKVYGNWSQRIPTARLNKAIEEIFKRNAPPTYRAAPIKLMFSTQVGISPPAFAVSANYPKGITEQYERYIKTKLREEFPFEGTDIRLIFKKRRKNQEEEE